MPNSNHWFSHFVPASLSGLALATGLVITNPAPTMAQAAYGSYVGVGGSFGLTEGSDVAAEGSNSGGVVAVRYRLLEVPISLRAQALISERTAIVPTVSYDIPLNWHTDAYIGAGASIVTGGDAEDTSPVGNQTSFVLQPGIDYSLPDSNLVVFGNAIFAFDGYKEGGGAGISVQGGVGLRF
ncbi:MAG: hypothetical protein SFY66_05445 [Oculatellaceae cyanobacterium bins.114]|nr:hypothetical protein [Oculatellaceae cyanobacterium bins.114]